MPVMSSSWTDGFVSWFIQMVIWVPKPKFWENTRRSETTTRISAIRMMILLCKEFFLLFFVKLTPSFPNCRFWVLFYHFSIKWCNFEFFLCLETLKPLGGASRSLRRPKLPLRTPFLATRFWYGDGRAWGAALGIGKIILKKRHPCLRAGCLSYLF